MRRCLVALALACSTLMAQELAPPPSKYFNAQSGFQWKKFASVQPHTFPLVMPAPQVCSVPLLVAPVDPNVDLKMPLLREPAENLDHMPLAKGLPPCPSQDSQPFLQACTVKNLQPCVDKPPRYTYAPAPECSEEASKKNIDSTMVLAIVVGTNGRVNDISVVQPLGYGLEKEATKAVKRWRFKPGTSLGSPVPVQIRVEMSFHCHPW